MPTRNDLLTERDDIFHLTERRRDNDARMREASDTEIDRQLRQRENESIYPDLKGSLEACGEARLFLLRAEIEETMKHADTLRELAIKAEAGGLDESEEIELWETINKETQRWVV